MNTSKLSSKIASLAFVGALVAGLSGCGTSAASSTTASSTAGEKPAASSAGSASAAANTRTVETAFGPVTIPLKPKTAIALEGGVGPLLKAGITPVATADGTRADSFLAGEYTKVKDLPVILGKDGWDYEKIAALQPDLLIGFIRGGTTATLSAEKKAEWEKLSQIAPTVFIRSDGSGKTKEASYQMSKDLGDVAAAEAAKKAYYDKAAEIKKTYAAKLAANTFAPVDSFETMTVYTPVSWIGSILTDIGAKIDPVAASVTNNNGVDLSYEQLGKLNQATVILNEMTVDGKPGEGAVEMEANPAYQALPAVKAKHAFGVRYFFADRYETGLDVLNQFEVILKGL